MALAMKENMYQYLDWVGHLVQQKYIYRTPRPRHRFGNRDVYNKSKQMIFAQINPKHPSLANVRTVTACSLYKTALPERELM
jgi:hypothetical protein